MFGTVLISVLSDWPPYRLLYAKACHAVSRWGASLFDPYRPELHYMRGPGPKWREKHGYGRPG
jgi:hypothetical protein